MNENTFSIYVLVARYLILPGIFFLILTLLPRECIPSTQLAVAL
jgi:hypothetical protein